MLVVKVIACILTQISVVSESSLEQFNNSKEKEILLFIPKLRFDY